MANNNSPKLTPQSSQPGSPSTRVIEGAALAAAAVLLPFSTIVVKIAASKPDGGDNPIAIYLLPVDLIGIIGLLTGLTFLIVRWRSLTVWGRWYRVLVLGIGLAAIVAFFFD